MYEVRLRAREQASRSILYTARGRPSVPKRGPLRYDDDTVNTQTAGNAGYKHVVTVPKKEGERGTWLSTRLFTRPRFIHFFPYEPIYYRKGVFPLLKVDKSPEWWWPKAWLAEESPSRYGETVVGSKSPFLLAYSVKAERWFLIASQQINLKAGFVLREILIRGNDADRRFLECLELLAPKPVA